MPHLHGLFTAFFVHGHLDGDVGQLVHFDGLGRDSAIVLAVLVIMGCGSDTGNMVRKIEVSRRLAKKRT